ncbi:MAG TPA: acyl-CoA dehydrogenase family protein [bacterium]|nr:acyl-CoA dehydrogenase family protein [bacterium]
MDVTSLTAGGSFLVTIPTSLDVCTPEDLSEEHRLAARTLRAFLDAEVEPRTAELETQSFSLVRELLRKLGALGFLGVDIPEAYGGTGLDFITSLLVAETMSRGSFAVSVGAHTVIGTLPIVYFGTEEQKRRYLPGLASGDLVGAYALTEPTAGSDALGARARAVRTTDGRDYLLTGTKQFITNAGFADVFTTYAKVDGERFTSFIVDRQTEGLVIGPEEHKMGIKGSSTASLFFDNARVPASNMLGEDGGGHRVALNILNIGRLKLGTSCLGAAKHAVRQAVAYAKERQQFGRAIASFGLVQQKLAQMAVRVYLLESVIYRAGGLIQAARQVLDTPAGAVEEYAIECAIGKVYGSEVSGFVMDELVQIFGGYGFIEDYPAARAYRDARISRIYEGTNEINRLLITSMLLRRGQRGRLPLTAALRDAVEKARNAPTPSGDGPLADERRQVEMAKTACLLAAAAAVQAYGEVLQEPQEIPAWIADLVIDIFAMESGLLRTLRALDHGRLVDAKVDLLRAGIDRGLSRVDAVCRQILAATLEGDELRARLAAVRRLLPEARPGAIPLRQRIAGRLLDAGAYVT